MSDKIMAFITGKLSMFSLEHLFQLLNALEKDVEIIIKPKSEHETVATTSALVAS